MVELGQQGVVDGAAEHDQQRGAEHEHAGVVHQAGRAAHPLPKADGHVVVERARGVHPARVLRRDPAEPQHADRRDEDGERRGDARAVPGRRGDAHDLRHEEGDGEHRAHEPDGLSDRVAGVGITTWKVCAPSDCAASSAVSTFSGLLPDSDSTTHSSPADSWQSASCCANRWIQRHSAFTPAPPFLRSTAVAVQR